VGGYDSRAQNLLDQVETVDMVFSNNNCRTPSNFPTPTADGVGALMWESPVVCGGSVASGE
jgi:hypothetical protein